MQHRRPAALLGAAALVAAAAAAGSVAAGSAAQASDTPRTALGTEGQKLSVSASANLDPDGETLRVTGEGYDPTKSVYVALCKDNGDNRVPTPCLGGADQSGTGSASQWITPEGDEYAGDLAVHWGAGGTFDVRLAVKAKDTGLDCTQVTCSVISRVDHRHPGDRSQDVRVPVTFEGQAPGGGSGGGDGVDVPPGTVGFVRKGDFTTAGKVRDLLLHPDSKKLYAASEDFADTGTVNEQGLYALDPADGRVLSLVTRAPNSAGTLASRPAYHVPAALAGDGVVVQFAVRGIGTAKDGDTEIKGFWPALTTSVSDIEPGADAGTVLVAQGATLSAIEYATGRLVWSKALDGGGVIGVDARNGAVWVADSAENGTLRRVDLATRATTATVALPGAGAAFVEADPATGNVWVGAGSTVRVFDKAGKELTTLDGGQERASDLAFDATTGDAFVVWQDNGDTGSGGDHNGALAVYDTTTFAAAAKTVPLPGNSGQYGRAGLAVAPGGTTVYVASPAEGTITRLERRVSPKVVQAPTDRTVTAGDKVTLVAAAEGTPAPTVRWQVSPDGGQTWSAVEDATAHTYSFTARRTHDGYAYRAEFTNDTGTTRTAPATLTVKTAGEGSGGGTGGDGGTPAGPSGTKTVTGAGGQKLTVTPVNDLATRNQTLRITGSGYDVKKGVYVALCVDNGDGELPTPCVGGVDMTGASHSSAWISSDPPDYGEDLATPYGAGGTFSVELTVDARDEYTDCFKATCVLATRADHTLSGDRSQDVKVPVAFVGQDPVDTDDGAGSSGGTDGGTDGGATGGTSGTTGGGSASGTAGATGGTSTTTTSGGGSLAATGATIGTAAGTALLLTAVGWYLHRRARTTPES
jgi:hypothetical protein